MKQEPERTCYNCRNFALCFVARSLDVALQHCHILNIDSTNAPKQIRDVYETMANACLRFERILVEKL